ncbi:MAG: hypothetical protein WC767_00370 [Candidatus Paceibacterota bacterium]|jgi:hypothetical protein
MDIQNKNNPIRSPRLQRIVIGVIAVISIVFNIYQARQIATLEDPVALNEARIAQYVREIGEAIVLPEGEVPTLATISDPEALKSQPFFANAKVGDIVLVYEVAKKAVLWRPSEKKLIEVSSVVAPVTSPAPAKR